MSYDKVRADKSSSGGSKRSSAPPPPPPPSPPEEGELKGEKSPEPVRGGGKVLAIVFAFFALALLIVAIQGGSSNRASDLMNVDNLAVDNLVVDDTASMDANMDMNASMTEAPNDLAQLDANLVATAPIVKTTLSGSPDPLRYADIEQAAENFSKVLFSSGILGARGYSEACHQRFSEAPSWSSADHCAAFDYAAAFFDAQVSATRQTPLDSYFRFQRENQSDVYEAAGAYTFQVSSRLTRIRAAAESAAREAIGNELAKQQRREADLANRDSRPGRAAAGVLLDSEASLGDGTKRCKFSNGTERVVDLTADCFKG